jgi:hypothetical protein
MNIRDFWVDYPMAIGAFLLVYGHVVVDALHNSGSPIRVYYAT